MIPKIIHQIAPKDQNRWHPVWKICHKTVYNTFKDFKLFLWDDKEDIDSFIEKNYPEYFDLYSSFPFHILKIDFSRYCILDYYGGIYADMDVYFYKNPYETLTQSSYVLEPFIFNSQEMLLNCIMAAQPKSNFFKLVLEECKNSYNQYTPETLKNIYDTTSYLTGPHFLYKCYEKYRDEVAILDKNLYHARIYDYNEEIISKHLKTQLWGDESIQSLQKVFDAMEVSYEEGMIKCFQDIRGIDIKNFDFYKQYD